MCKGHRNMEALGRNCQVMAGDKGPKAIHCNVVYICSGSWHIVEAHFATVTLRKRNFKFSVVCNNEGDLSVMIHISNEPAGVQQLCGSEVLPQVAGGLCANSTSPHSRTQVEQQPL